MIVTSLMRGSTSDDTAQRVADLKASVWLQRMQPEQRCPRRKTSVLFLTHARSVTFGEHHRWFPLALVLQQLELFITNS